MKAKQKLTEVAKEAYNKRAELIALYKKQGRGNVVLRLKFNCTYIYGETVPTPLINFGCGNSVTDMELWSKTIWAKQ